MYREEAAQDRLYPLILRQVDLALPGTTCWTHESSSTAVAHGPKMTICEKLPMAWARLCEALRKATLHSNAGE